MAVAGECGIEGCERPRYARMMCRPHYSADLYSDPEKRARQEAYKAAYNATDRARAKRRANNATPEGKSASIARDLMRKYGLTVEAFDAMLSAQGGGCAVCGATPAVTGRRLAVDHDHGCCPGERSCGKCVRGLLCFACNSSLGKLGDDPARLRAAADYLESHMAREALSTRRR